MTRLFKLYFGTSPNPWYLSDPDPWLNVWPRGGRAESVDRVRFDVTREGVRVDVTIPRGMVIVKEWVGDLIGRLAPGDVQRIPAQIDGEDERYELLHVATRMDCIDWEHTPAQALSSNGVANGTLGSLAHLVDRANLYRYVAPGDMVLDSRGIEGARIFRVVDWNLYAVVTERVKQALEEAQVNGVEFPEVKTS